MMEIRIISSEADLRLPNESFSMPGRFIPALQDGEWSWREEIWPEPERMCFPDENYSLTELEQNHVLLGAYAEDRCVGVAIYRREWLRYLYLEDLKVNGAFRGRGIGKALVEAGLAEARKLGYRGVWATCQDNNLLACRFYLKTGFRIGGFDNRVYTGTSQEGKANIEFYLDNSER